VQLSPETADQADFHCSRFPITGIFANRINNFRRDPFCHVLELSRHPASRGIAPVAEWAATAIVVL
jgi:hypothetical protein